ncbi:MAG: elongation factor G [Thermoanaerobaculia bacterium]
MQVESPDKIRNVALAGHSDTGKTTLASALLYAGGQANRLNKPDDGGAPTDFDPEEVARGISIGLGTCAVPWNGNKINVLDCPGYGIFFAETQVALRATDATVLCVNAASGVEVMTEKVWRWAERFHLPVLFALTKMDRERASLESALETLHERFGREAVAVQIPIGSEHDFHGVVDLVTGKAWLFEPDGDGKGKPTEVPGELAERVAEARRDLLEMVAETDDALLEEFFDKGTLPDDDFARGLRAAVVARKIFPVTLVSGAHGIGCSTLLQSIVDLLPNPLEREAFPARNVGAEPIEVTPSPEEPLSALVFKTISDPFAGKISILRVVSGSLDSDTPVWNPRTEEGERIGQLMEMQGKQGTPVPKLVTGDIGGVAKLKAHSGDTLCDKDRPVHLGWIDIAEPAISFAAEPKSKGDEEKIGEALARLQEEDLTLRAGRDPETGEFLLSGTGQLHVEIAVAKLKNRFHVDVILHPPKVPYRETIRRGADGHGRHKKQSGGRGQFADCRIKLEPLQRGEDFEFVDEIFGGSIPQGFRPAVEKGIQEARVKGYLAGFPVVDFRVKLVDGQYHDVDSSEMAFKVAGSLAFKDAMTKAAPVLLEPMMKVEVTIDESFMGDVMSDLSSRRGRPQGMDAKNGRQVISATVPMAEMLTYAPSLNSMTQGKGSFHMEFSHYEEVPNTVAQKIIEASKKQDEAD